jgi:hypothetical protein
MTTTNGSSAPRGRRVKFTPKVLDEVKNLLTQGVSRDEIANRIGVTLGSLQVTCSRLRISLRRPGSGRGVAHTAQANGVAHATPGTPSFKVELIMRHEGEERTSDIPLALPVIGELALEAMSRDLKIAELIEQLMVSAINKDLIHKILSKSDGDS